MDGWRGEGVGCLVDHDCREPGEFTVLAVVDHSKPDTLIHQDLPRADGIYRES
jgi:hypothetical protein